MLHKFDCEPYFIIASLTQLSPIIFEKLIKVFIISLIIVILFMAKFSIIRGNNSLASVVKLFPKANDKFPMLLIIECFTL